MVHALSPRFRLLFASALLLAPPAVPVVAAAAPRVDPGPAPVCVPWILCHIKLPGRLAIADSGGGQKSIELLSWSFGGSPARLSSDPEEGGEIAARTVRKPSHPSVSELTVSKKTDTASPTLLRSSDGGTATPGHAGGAAVQTPVAASDPPPSGTLTIVTARGSCATGQHIPEVKLTARGRTYTLHDVDVTGCADSGDNTDTCTLSYGSVAG